MPAAGGHLLVAASTGRLLLVGLGETGQLGVAALDGGVKGLLCGLLARPDSLKLFVDDVAYLDEVAESAFTAMSVPGFWS